MSAQRTLSPEERIIWGRVARTAAPLPGRKVDADLLAQEFHDGPVHTAGPSEGSPRSEEPPPVRPGAHASPSALDRQTRVKLARGRIAIEGRIDLHGLTQSEAHGLLLSFLHRAHGEGRRHVLVVTGKGSSLGSDGALKRAAPHWFATPPFRSLVSGYETAARGHGGDGALYVRLRRK